ncbi:hypothetical protein [Tateyamaria sp.]|uniref:hypothetical protein n=1 Tax=Tateyamaria sp. TaxID=1929288 RepID=UPI0039B8B4A4
MADINAPFMEQIFNIAKGQRETDVHHNRQSDNLTARFEIAKRIKIGHPARLQTRPARLNPVSSDSADRGKRTYSITARRMISGLVFEVLE